MFYYLEKYTNANGTEYIEPLDIFKYGPEDNPVLQEAYQFADMIAKELNYYVNNRSTAFGNPDLEFARGMIKGYLTAKRWDMNRETGKSGIPLIVIRSRSGKALYKIEIPAIPQDEFDRRREISKDLDALGI